jgi:hypothetical protein
MGIETQADRVLWWLAISCTVLLLFGPLGGRTEWVHRDGATITDAAGYDWLAPLAGVVAIIGLGVGRRSRQHAPIAVLGAAVATISLSSMVVVAGTYWLAIERGDLQSHGVVLDQSGGYFVRPAAGPPFVALIAAVAATFAVILTVRWLSPPRAAH